jgi:phosphoglycolate phosphatase
MSGGGPAAVGLVMFDLDGTLVATAPEIHDAVNDTLARFALHPVREQQVETWIGHGTRELLARALAASTGTSLERVKASDSFEGIAAEFGSDYQRRCGTRSHLYPHVRAVLRELRRRRVRLAVVTNKDRRFTDTVLQQHALAPLLDAVIGGDSLPTRKPDPAGLLHCMQTLGAAAGRCLFVGDSGIDVATARGAGIPVWAVSYGYNMGRPVAEEGPDRVIDDLRPLLSLVPS